MITGGTNAAGKAGGLRCGWSESYLPCRVFLLNQAVVDMFEQSRNAAIPYVASFRIWDAVASAWVALPDVVSFNVTRNAGGALDAADLVVKRPETWSPWRTTPHPGLLLPSTAIAQIFAGVRVNGNVYQSPIFEGHIVDSSEVTTPSSGEITLRLEEVRDFMGRLSAATVQPPLVSTYRYILAQYMTIVSGGYSGPSSLGTWRPDKIRITIPDLEIDTEQYFAFGTTLETAIEKLVPGLPLLQIKGAGELTIGRTTDSIAGQDPTFSYTDAANLSVTRAVGQSQFNTVRTFGLVDGVPTADRVWDAADVARRGHVVYAAGAVGSYALTLAEANTIALESIAAQLAGTLQVEVKFNPWLTPGMWIGLQSDKAALPASKGRLKNLTHTFSATRHRTTIKDFVAVPV